MLQYVYIKQEVAMIATINGMGNVTLNEKTFKTGSKGHYGAGKLTDKSGKRFQVNVQLVEIGSKPKK